MKLVLNKNNFLVFFISILFCVVLKLFEEFVGIGWDYHPDALLYINSSDFIVSQIKLNSSFFNYLNNGYYFLVSFLNSSKLLLVSLNVILYSLTNVLFYKKIKYFKSKYFYLFFLFVILSPYRAHLAVHVLKDTIIIFLLTYFVFSKTFFTKISLLFLNVYVRIFSIIYHVYANYKKRISIFSYLFLISTIILIVLNFPVVFDFIIERNVINMGGRGFDQINNFSDYGQFGFILRSLIWPIIFVTGFFLFLSPSILYIPIFMEILSINLYTNFKFIKSLKFILALSILALIVNSFTAYIRYIYPLLILTVINIKNNES